MDRWWMFGFGRQSSWLVGLIVLIGWIMAEPCLPGCTNCENSKCITCSKFLDVSSGKCIDTCPKEQVQMTSEGKQCQTIETADSPVNNHALLIGVSTGGAVLFLVIVTGIMYFRRSRDEELQSNLVEAAIRRKSTQDYSHMNGGFEHDLIGPSEFRSRVFALKPELPTYVAMLNEVKKKADENPMNGSNCPYRTTFIELTRFVLLLKSNILNVSVVSDSKQTLEWAEHALKRYKETKQINMNEDADERQTQSIPNILVTKPEKLTIEMEAIDEHQMEVTADHLSSDRKTEETSQEPIINDDKIHTEETDIASHELKSIAVVNNSPEIPDVDYDTESQSKELETHQNHSVDILEKEDPMVEIPETDYETTSDIVLPFSDEDHSEENKEIPVKFDLLVTPASEAVSDDDATDDNTEIKTEEAVKPENDSLVTPNATEGKCLADILTAALHKKQINDIETVTKSEPKQFTIPDPPRGEIGISTPTISTPENRSPAIKPKLLGPDRQMGFDVSVATLVNIRGGLRSVNKNSNEREVLINKSPDNKESRRQRNPTLTASEEKKEPPTPQKNQMDVSSDVVNEKPESENKNEPLKSEVNEKDTLPLIQETDNQSEDEDDMTSL